MNIDLTQAMIVEAAQKAKFIRLSELEAQKPSIAADDTIATIRIENSGTLQNVVVKRLGHGLEKYSYQGSLSGFTEEELKPFCHEIIKQMRAKCRSRNKEPEMSKSKQLRVLKKEEKEVKKLHKKEKKKHKKEKKRKEKAKEKSHKRKKRRRSESPPPQRMRPSGPKVVIEGEIRYDKDGPGVDIKGRCERNPNPFQ